MFDKLKESLNHYNYFLGPRDIYQLVSITKLRSLEKGAFFVKEGDLNHNVALVVKGLFRIYVTNDSGEEHTMLFIPEKKNAASYETILRNRPSTQNIVALEDSLIIVADFRKFENLVKNNPSLMLYQNRVLKDILAFTVEQVKSHVILTPEQRYLNFCKQFPKLEQRVKQKDLASYLGVTPTSLSRMRARLSK